jgi:polysaccharide biosynthesis protein PslH
MARILFVTPYPISRIRIRSYGFVSQLVRQHDVTVIALCSGEQDLADMWALKKTGTKIIAVQEKRWWQYGRSLRACASSTPFQVAFGAAPGLQAEIDRQLRSQHFDVLHVESVRALGALPTNLTVPVVWDAVDCISQLYEQGARFGATPMLRLIGQREAVRIQAYEHSQLKRFRQTLVTSERDRRALLFLKNGTQVVSSEHSDGIMVIPHGVDQHYFQRAYSSRKPETLVFSGKMSFHANIAGVLHLVEHIMPHIWKQRPATRLIIAGSNPPSCVRRLAHDARIDVTGYVADLRPYIAQAQVAVSPLPYAVGIQNKVLEAMALGTPVVASSSASAGLQVVPERDVLVADDPEHFAASVLRLLDDHILWKSLSDGGVAYVSTHHNWTMIIEQLNAVYAQAMENADVDEIVAI